MNMATSEPQVSVGVVHGSRLIGEGVGPIFAKADIIRIDRPDRGSLEQRA